MHSSGCASPCPFRATTRRRLEAPRTKLRNKAKPQRLPPEILETSPYTVQGAGAFLSWLTARRGGARARAALGGGSPPRWSLSAGVRRRHPRLGTTHKGASEHGVLRVTCPSCSVSRASGGLTVLVSASPLPAPELRVSERVFRLRTGAPTNRLYWGRSRPRIPRVLAPLLG